MSYINFKYGNLLRKTKTVIIIIIIMIMMMMMMSAYPKIAQSLYTSRHDKMVRPYYQYLVSAYGFNKESNHKRTWY